ncbi:MAG: endoribonuclease MazF [Spirochaetales bacterium]|nr:endoribonuclease MazF [Spirochaetales bacterium]
MPRPYCPRRGDIVWLTFDPRAGHEQAGHRPALVLSPEPYNRKVGLAILCPITSRVKGYPFEVGLPDDLEVSGVVLSDQVKNLDWKTRKASFCCKAPSEVLKRVLGKLGAILNC